MYVDVLGVERDPMFHGFRMLLFLPVMLTCSLRQLMKDIVARCRKADKQLHTVL